MKVIPTKVHGMLDYLAVATALVLPRILNWHTTITSMLTIAAIGMLAYTLVTKFELGVFKILPMKGHLGLDALAGLLMIGAPFLVAGVGRSETIGLIGLGVMELLVVLLSQTHSPVERESLSPQGF